MNPTTSQTAVRDDLKTAAGLAKALEQAGGSWANLSSETDIPASTLKTWGSKRGVKRSKNSALSVIRPESLERRSDAARLALEEETKKELEAIAEKRQHAVEEVLKGQSDELGMDWFMLAVEIDTVETQGDHVRLLRAASLALQYWPDSPTRNRNKYLKKIAATCHVEARDLDDYTIVLGREIRYRKKTGQSPIDSLPQLLATNTADQDENDE